MSNDTSTIDERGVAQTAAVLGLEIPPERMPGVVATLQNVAKVAAIVNNVTLAPDDELALVWKP